MNNDKKLSFLEKTLCITSGPIIGLLPPRLQMKITKNNYEAASLMSSTSRVFNGLWSLYTTTSLLSKAFGADIDPTPYNITTWSGILVAADTMIREFLYGVHYFLNNPFSDYKEPWGEPIWSMMDQGKNPKWYKSS